MNYKEIKFDLDDITTISDDELIIEGGNFKTIYKKINSMVETYNRYANEENQIKTYRDLKYVLDEIQTRSDNTSDNEFCIEISQFDPKSKHTECLNFEHSDNTEFDEEGYIINEDDLVYTIEFIY